MARAQSKNEKFVINWSPKKIWAYAIFCWAFSIIVILLPSLFLAWLASSNIESSLNFLVPAGILLFGFAAFAWLPFIFLKRRHQPLAVLNKSGYTGLGNRFRPKHQNWQSDTKLIFMKGIILVNPDSLQSKASELFWGPKNGVRISHILAKQNRYEIEAAIERLNPYS